MSRVITAIQGHAREQPDCCAIRDDQLVLDWQQLATRVENRAAQLRDTGITRLVIAGDNSADWLIWDLATLAAGVASIPLPPFFTQAQIDHVIDTTGANGLAHDEQLKSWKSPTPRDWPEATAKVTFTSGTTGTPKGVCLSLEAVEDVACSIAAATKPLELSTHLAVLPLAILLENIAGAYAAVIRGLEIVLPGAAARGLNGSSNFRPQPLLDSVARHQASSLILVPEMLKQILLALERQQAPASLRFVAVGGARVGSALIDKARQRGVPAYEGYGLSECASVVSLNLPFRDRPGSAGVPLEHVRMRIEDGLLEIHNPGFLGYLGGPPAASDAWINTGDEAQWVDGALQLAGRRRNVFITAFGRNLSPEWPESELLAEAEIAQVIVFGEALPAPRALIEAEARIADVELAAAVSRANQRLPDYARIATWQRLPEPLNETNGLVNAAGKPRRRLVIERYLHLFDNELKKETA